ncbi:hypothetical protein [Marinitenerispora sediminis]|uniref:hypothetical protein n=1 Tax=Marinitenerispora sediminis TaxID=1931232 RepID=UPI0013145AFC|nr:hypothetical protein [Marinitenerispora sediminis]
MHHETDTIDVERGPADDERESVPGTQRGEFRPPESTTTKLSFEKTGTAVVRR